MSDHARALQDDKADPFGAVTRIDPHAATGQADASLNQVAWPVIRPAARKAPVVAAVVALALVSAGLFLSLLDLPGLSLRTLEMQRDLQNAMAGHLRGIRAGAPAALGLLCAITFTYGLLHAIGPGHGKLVLGATAATPGVRFKTIAGLTLASSLGQSLVAVLIVGGAAAALDATRHEITALSDGLMTAISYAAIACIGALWAVRGLRSVLRAAGPPADRCIPSMAMNDGTCACGHRHGPTSSEIARATGWQEKAGIVASIAIRPCTGALFLLIIAWKLDIFIAGMLATFAMGAGTAAFNLIVSTSVFGVRSLMRPLGMMGALGGYGVGYAHLTAGSVLTITALSSLLTLL